MAIVTARINPDGPRAADWRRVFGAEEVPLESPFAQVGSAPGVGRSLFYQLAVGQLGPATRKRLVAFLAERFLLTEAEIILDLLGPHGLPILADDVTVNVDARAFL